MSVSSRCEDRLRQIRTDLEELKIQNRQLRKHVKELLERNYQLEEEKKSDKFRFLRSIAHSLEELNKNKLSKKH